jgi:hypothetical protein
MADGPILLPAEPPASVGFWPALAWRLGAALIVTIRAEADRPPSPPRGRTKMLAQGQENDPMSTGGVRYYQDFGDFTPPAQADVVTRRFELFRGEPPADDAEADPADVFDQDVNQATFRVAGLELGETVTLRHRFVDRAGNVSPLTPANVLTWTVEDTTAPDAPGAFAPAGQGQYNEGDEPPPIGPPPA